MKTFKMKKKLFRNFSLGFILSVLCITAAIFAVSVTGSFNTFQSGQTVDASAVNTNFATLKSAIEGIPSEKAWRLIYENDVTATTGSVSVTGLDGDSDVEYMIITKFVGATAGAGGYYLELNSDNVNCNYKIFEMYVVQSNTPANQNPACPSGAGLHLANSNGSSITSNSIFVSKLLLHNKSGTKRVANGETGKAVSLSEALYTIGTSWWENTTSNITSMRFFYTVGNGIGAGSRMEIWAKR